MNCKFCGEPEGFGPGAGDEDPKPTCCLAAQVAWCSRVLDIIQPFVKHENDTRESGWFDVGFDNMRDVLETVATRISGVPDRNRAS